MTPRHFTQFVLIWGATLAGLLATTMLSGCGRPKLTQSAPAGWDKVDAGPFSILAPPGWKFHKQQGIDSFVGEFVGTGVTLEFDFGAWSNPLEEEKEPEYIVNQKSIGGFPAKIVSPQAPGHGITGIYFHDVGNGTKLCFWGKNLTSTQQELALKVFETVQFEGPPYNYFPPSPSANTDRP
jgi:hypothetical protein